MAGLGWISVAIAALPHITDLVKASKDLLKNRKPNTAAPIDISTIDDPLARVTAACENNTESIRLLTEQMQSQLQHYQNNATMLQKRLRRMTTLSVIAAIFALIALAKTFNFL